MHWLVERSQARSTRLHDPPLQHAWLKPPQAGGAAQRPFVQVSPSEQVLPAQQMLPLPPQARQKPFALQASPSLHCPPMQQVCPAPPQRIFGLIGLEGCAGPAAAMKMPAGGAASPILQAAEVSWACR